MQRQTMSVQMKVRRWAEGERGAYSDPSWAMASAVAKWILKIVISISFFQHHMFGIGKVRTLS